MTADGPGPRGRLMAWLGRLAALLAVAGLAWALVRGWSQVRSHDWHPDALPLTGCVVALVCFYLLSGAGYVATVEAIGSRRAPRRGVLAAWAVSLLGRYVPGSVVMVVGRMELSRRLGVSRGVTVAAMAYEQVLSLAAAAAGGAVFVLVYGRLGPAWLSWLVVLVPLALLALHPRVMAPVTAWPVRAPARPPLPAVVPMRRVLGLVAAYAVAAVLLGLGTWLFVRGLGGVDAGGPGFVGSAFLFAVAVSLLAVVVPSGLGVRDGAFAVALTQHVPGGVAVALSVGSRLALTLVELAVVGATAFWARRA
ncbi:MAG: hypothetical protein U0Y82_03925 [Thermoleophilia bacterium]